MNTTLRLSHVDQKLLIFHEPPVFIQCFCSVRVASSLVFGVLLCRSLIVIQLFGRIISLKGMGWACKTSLIQSLCSCIQPPCQWPSMHMSASWYRFNLCLYDGLLYVFFFSLVSFYCSCLRSGIFDNWALTMYISFGLVLVWPIYYNSQVDKQGQAKQ